MKNIKFNKKKVGSLLLALGIMITPNLSKALIKSYGMKTSLVDGREIVLYYSNDNNKSFISLDNQLGFIDNEYISNMEFDPNDYFMEVNSDDYIKVDNASLYNDPDKLETINYLSYGTKVHLYVKTNDGYYVCYANNQMGFIHESSLIEPVKEEVIENNDVNPNLISVAKITGNNINVRYSPKKGDNIIGFCDKTDKFIITGYENGFYQIDYLGQTGYVSEKYVTNIEMDKNDLQVYKMVYLPNGGAFYDENGGIYCYLPANQNVQIIESTDDYYKGIVDGVIGYIKKKSTKSLTEVCIVVDVSRQILKVYKKGKEVFRCKVITGAKGRETQLGCFKIGHHMEGYTFPDSDIYNEYWIQFDGNRGIHPADANAGKGWQKKSYFQDNVNKAYELWASGKGKTYALVHGSHGCVNTMIEDTMVIYSLCSVGDNILIIEQNDLIINKIIGNNLIEDNNKELIKELI